MSVQPTTSFVLTQPTQPPPGSLVLTHQPGLVLSQQVAAEPPDTIVLGHHGASVPGSFVLTQPSAAPIGSFVPPQLVLPAGTEIAMESRQGNASEGMTTLNEFQAAPVFSQAGRGPKMEAETRTSDVPVYHIPSGSQLTVLQPPPGQQESVRVLSPTYLLFICGVPVFTCAVAVSVFMYLCIHLWCLRWHAPFQHFCLYIPVLCPRLYVQSLCLSLHIQYWSTILLVNLQCL